MSMISVDPVAIVSQAIAACNEPSPHVPDWFRNELTRIGGLNDYGEPIVRIVWGGEAMRWARGRWRIKHPTSNIRHIIGWEVIKRTPDGSPYRVVLPPDEASNPAHGVGRLVRDWLDIGKSYFYIEEWMPPEVACAGWDEDLKKWNPETMRDELAMGPMPRRGLYTTLCCLIHADRSYMEPGEYALEHIARMFALKRACPVLWDPRSPKIPDWFKTQMALEHDYEAQQAEAKDLAEMEEAYLSDLAPAKKLLTHPHPNEGGGKLILR